MNSIICHKPPSYVPYKGTYAPYDGTFGAPDQGQMLDMWERQTAESALRDDWPQIVPSHTLEVVLEVTLEVILEHRCMWRHRVQLVGELLLELLVRGSNPSGVGLLLESAVRGWNPTCPIRVHLSVATGNHTCERGMHLDRSPKTIWPSRDRTPWIGHH